MKSMGLNTRFTVGSVILAILLLSIFGVNRAFRSLTGNPPETERIESSRVDAFTASDKADDSRPAASQSNAPATDIRTRNEAGELEFTPLQTAGTFVQRQKSIAEDPTVSSTKVSVLAVADDASTNSTATSAQSNTITTDQSGTTSSTSPKPASTKPATSPAVPALW